MRRWRVHKTVGTNRIVYVDAERMRFEGGCLVFTSWDDSLREYKVVMAYSPSSWRSVFEENGSAE